MNLAEVILASLSDWGSHPAALIPISGNQAEYVSADQLRDQIRELAGTLRGWGIQRRHTVAIFLENSLDFVRLFGALLLLEAVPVPLKLEYRRLELEEIFSVLQPSAVVTDESHLPVLGSRVEGTLLGGHTAEGFRLLASPGRARPPAELDDHVASLNFTYRGHGYPLAAMVSHQQYLDGAQVLQEGLQGRRGDRLLVLLPMAHIFSLVGCVLVPLLYGMTMVISRSLHPRMLFDQIRRYGVSTLTAVPEVFELLARVKDPEVGLPSLEALVCGGSVLSVQGYEHVRTSLSAQLLHGYGLTEFAPVSRNIRHQARPGTVGPPGRGVECSIRQPDQVGRGEILVRCPSLSRGYYRRPKETAEAFEGPWFRTGDLGRVEDGHLVFERELKATRKVNGNMVDLNEVRRALLDLPEIREARVEHSENRLIARLGLAGGSPDRERSLALKQRLKGIIAEYKIPRMITAL